jgi:hypothetical protein
MNSVLSAIGLALDLVGAVVLVVGLFRPLRPMGYGTAFVYGPDDAARDAGFAVAGAPLLALGFFLQSLPYFGVSLECSTWVNAIAAGIALVGGSLYALLAYRVTHRVVLNRRR